ncbi:unannotated protein [freshwater metagenome]|uniref:Unannotated protein n=1 Tax=freshwater metagenome TaxID=449393 RepID=A0A6J6ZVJ8_9ZZZZ
MVGDLDADGGAPGDRGKDAHVHSSEGVRNVFLERGDPRDFHTRPELQFVTGDRGPHGLADEADLHAVRRERLLEHAPTRLHLDHVDRLVRRPPEGRERRKLPLARFGCRTEVEVALFARSEVVEDRFGAPRGLSCRLAAVRFGCNGHREVTLPVIDRCRRTRREVGRPLITVGEELIVEELVVEA